MIDIAICDSDLITSSLIERLIIDIEKAQNIKINYEIFYDSRTLINMMSLGKCFDMIYMNIDQKNSKVIKTAEIIRNIDVNVLIIYLSSHEFYLHKLFKTEPFNFLQKPINTTVFYSVFMLAFKKIQSKNEYFYYTFNKTYVKIPISKIYFFESQSRLIYIHVKSGKHDFLSKKDYRFYSRMTDVENQINASNYRFIRIHQSFLVNFDYIESMNHKTVLMENGNLLRISEDRQKNVLKQFLTMKK